MCRNRPRRLAFGRVLVTLTLLCAVSLTGDPANAQAGGDEFFYHASGSATPILVEMQRDTYILDPILNLNPLDTSVNVTSTGDRQATASLFNPGPLGEFPALIGLAVSGLPDIPYPGYPLTVRASHPVTPEEVLGVGDVPGGSGGAANGRAMTVRVAADERSSTAEGTGARFGVAADLLTVGGVESRSFAEDLGDSVAVVVESSFADVDVAGLVHLDGVETRIEVSIDARSMRATSRTTVERATALGAELAIDENGLSVVTILGVPAPPSVAIDAVSDQLEAALAELGLSMRLLPGQSVEVPSDGTAPLEISAGGLEIALPITVSDDIAVPSIPGFPLGLPIGGGVPTTTTVRLASAEAGASAGAVGDFFLTDSFDPLSPEPTMNPSPDPASAGAPLTPPATPTADEPPSPAPAGDSAATETAAPSPTGVAFIDQAEPIAFDFTPAFRWAVIAAFGALAAGWPLVRRRLAGRAVSPRDLLASLASPSRRVHR